MQPRYRLLVFLLILFTLLGLYYSWAGGDLSRLIYGNYRPRRYVSQCRTAPIYRNFGIDMPRQYTVHGIDVSEYQDKIYWTQVADMRVGKQQVQFVFARATMGRNRTDDRFSQNRANAKAQALLFGAYHYFDPAQTAAEQAEHFLKIAKPQRGDLPPVLDIEEIRGRTPERLAEGLQIWLDAVEKATQTKPIIYTNIKFYKKYIEPYFKDYPLWIAHYYEDDLSMPSNTAWAFWQHNDRAQINGICSDVDVNVYNGNLSDLRKILIGAK